MKQFVLQSCFLYITEAYRRQGMTDEGFNIFDECAARCVHLFRQEEKCTSSSWWDSKMYRHIYQHSKFTEDASWNKRKCHHSQNKVTWYETLPKFCADKIFFLHLWQDKSLWVELKTNGEVIFIATLLSLFYFCRNSQYPEKWSVSFKNFFRKCECISFYLPISLNLQFQF